MAEKRWTHPPSRMDAVFHSLIKHTRSARAGRAGILPLAEVDRLVSAIRRFDPKHPTLANAPWGWRVEPNVPHLYRPITDIPVAYSNKEELPVAEFAADKWLITPKLDGVSVIAYYKNGVLQRCVTQGDGVCGWDVTNNVVPCVPVVIYPSWHLKRKARFTGYIRCKATMHADRFIRNHPKAVALKDAVHNLLTIETVAPKASPRVSVIPVNIYDMSYDQYVRVNSPGWHTYTRGFTHKLNFIFAMFDHADYLTEDRAAKLSRPYPYNGLVVRKYDGEDKLQGIFTYTLKGKADPVYTTVKEVAWDTTPYGKLHPTIRCERCHVGGVYPLGVIVDVVCGYSYRYVLANGIRSGTRLGLARKAGGQITIEEIKHPARSPVHEPDVKCSCGCDPEFLEFGDVHAYCRNPRCPSTVRAVFKSALDIFAPDYFYAPTRKRVMKRFHNDVFEFWGYYKNIGDASDNALLIDGLFRAGKRRYCELLRAMLKWEITVYQLIKLCNIEYMGITHAKLIEGKASTSKELTAWAEETRALPEDWRVQPKASENWTRRHGLIKEVLKFFKVIHGSSVLKQEAYNAAVPGSQTADAA